MGGGEGLLHGGAGDEIKDDAVGEDDDSDEEEAYMLGGDGGGGLGGAGGAGRAGAAGRDLSVYSHTRHVFALNLRLDRRETRAFHRLWTA